MKILVFKGGTCLAKIYADFYRLSEDLDFVIPMPTDARRSVRSRQAKGLKDIVAALPDKFPYVRVIEPLTGSNNSIQYNAVIGYTSSLGGREETIKIEVGLREPLLLPPLDGEAKTILLDPVTGQALIPTKKVRCISKQKHFRRNSAQPCRGGTWRCAISSTSTTLSEPLGCRPRMTT